MPARRPSPSTTGRWLWCLSAIFFATDSASSSAGDDDRVGGHQVADVGREGLVEPLLEALHRADEDDPAHDVEVVRQVQVGLLLAEDQVGLADDADDLVLGVDDRRSRPRSVLASRSIALRRVLLAGDGGHVGVHDLGGGLHRRTRLFDGGAGKHPNRDRVDHVGGDHRLGGADPLGGVAPGPGVGEDRGAGRGEGLEAAGEQRRDRSRRARRRSRRSPGAGAERTLTATRSPSVTIVSSPLRTTTAPAARAASRAQARRWAPTSSESRPSRRPSSPACGVRTVGAPRARDPPESPGEGVEAVGVEHERRLDLRGRPRAPARPSRGRGRGRGRARRRRRPRRRPARAFAEPGARQPSPPGQPTDITSGWPCSKIGSRSAGTATVA